MLIFFNYAFSWSRECIMCAAFMKGKHNDESKCIHCPLQITDLYTGANSHKDYVLFISFETSVL